MMLHLRQGYVIVPPDESARLERKRRQCVEWMQERQRQRDAAKAAREARIEQARREFFETVRREVPDNVTRLHK